MHAAVGDSQRSSSSIQITSYNNSSMPIFLVKVMFLYIFNFYWIPVHGCLPLLIINSLRNHPTWNHYTDIFFTDVSHSSIDM